MGVKEVLCFFRLALEGKTGKVTAEPSRSKFLENFLENDFALWDAESSTSREGIADLPLLRTLLAKSHYFLKVSRVKFLGTD